MKGNLAVVPLSGGGPREVLENVSGAGWSPDGKSLAVIHEVGGMSGTRRIEYPIGKVLYETSGGLFDLAVSPRGDLLAYTESTSPYDNRGSLAVVDLSGRRRTLSDGWTGFGWLTFSPRGDEIWFTGSRPGIPYGEIHAVTLSGKERVLTRMAGGALVADVSRDGGVLIHFFSCHMTLHVLVPGETNERDLSWFDQSSSGAGAGISDDGKLVAFTEAGQASSSLSDAYVRKTDGSPAVRLGAGTAMGLSPDGHWVLVYVATVPPELRALPVGAGAATVFDHGDVVQFEVGSWFPTGNRIYFSGRERGHGWRIYTQDIGGKPRAISPEGFRAMRGGTTPDGRFIAAFDPKGARCLYPADGGEPRPIPRFEGRPVRISSDGQSLFTLVGDNPGSVFKMNLTNGAKELWKTVTPPDPQGVEGGFQETFHLTPDGRGYSYSCERCQNDLYLVEGLR
jgi:eukaryotic-like serine/threonine-protein kinase